MNDALSSATDVLVLDRSGNVGIRNTSPDKMLTLGTNNDTSNPAYIRLKGHNTLEGNIYKTADYGIYMDTNSNNQGIRIDGGKLVLGMTGNVGIGTISPQDKLHVYDGDIGIENSSGKRYRLIAEASGGFTIRDQNAAAGRLYINTSGYVGIGTSPTSHKLEVDGNVKAKAYSSDYIALYNIGSGSYTAGTWYDFTDRTTIANYGYGNGMYIFRIYDDTFGGGGGNYFINYLSEPFWFENTASNATRGMEFTISGVAMGHAANGFPSNKIRIRLLENYGGVPHDFQWSPGGSNLTLDQTSGKRVYIYLHKWGGT